MLKMKHLNNAHKAMNQPDFNTFGSTSGNNGSRSKYIAVDNESLHFTIQDGPIKEVGVNGLQATDLLNFTKELFKSLNKDFPCRENALTITKIEEAIHWQDARTRDRESRKVEGYNKD